VEVFSFCGGVVQDSVILGYDAASLGNRFPTFRRTVFKNQTPRPLKTMMARRFFETPGTSDPVTWRLAPEERNPGVLRLLVSNVRLARRSHVQFAACDSVRMKLSLQYRDSVTQHTPAALYPQERPGTHYTGGWVGPRAGLDGRKISPPLGFDPRTVQPVAQSLYRLSYPAHTNFKIPANHSRSSCLQCPVCTEVATK